MGNRTCPFDGCRCLAPPEFFACGPHWRLMLKDEREEAAGLYMNWKQGYLTAEGLRAAQRDLVLRVQDRRKDDKNQKRGRE